MKKWLLQHPKLCGATVAAIMVVCAFLFAFWLSGCSLRHGWAPSNYRSRPLPPDRIECWQPGEHWTEKGQACHDVRGERDGNKELP